jgi:hypothetical protein
VDHGGHGLVDVVLQVGLGVAELHFDVSCSKNIRISEKNIRI